MTRLKSPDSVHLLLKLHFELQTDKWLEEIKDRVPEVEIGVQTDAVRIADISEPLPSNGSAGPAAAVAPEALFSPPPPSNDAWTQIEVTNG